MGLACSSAHRFDDHLTPWLLPNSSSGIPGLKAEGSRGPGEVQPWAVVLGPRACAEHGLTSWCLRLWRLQCGGGGVLAYSPCTHGHRSPCLHPQAACWPPLARLLHIQPLLVSAPAPHSVAHPTFLIPAAPSPGKAASPLCSLVRPRIPAGLRPTPSRVHTPPHAQTLSPTRLHPGGPCRRHSS